MTAVSEFELARFARAVEAELGLRVDYRSSTAIDVIARRAAAHREPVASYLERVDNAEPAEIRALVGELTVGETYFFRHAEQFRALVDVVLPQRLARRGHVRILSAGCASGEEPYTIAILARELLEPRAVTIRAIDVNPASLAAAACGRYSRWALRATPPELERRWFEPDGRDVVLSPAVRGAVELSEHNLIDDAELWRPETWDIVFCRNVLMYFTDARAQQVIERLTRAIAPGGFLFLGHAETLRDRSDDFELCHTHGTFYYQRRPAPTERVPAPTAASASLVANLPPDTSWFTEIQAAAERVHSLVDGALAATHTIAAQTVPTATLAEIRTLMIQERYGEALAAIAALPAAAAADRDAVLLEAVVLVHAGRLADAESTCRTLLALDAASAGAHYLLALCHGGRNNAVGAKHHAELAVELDPSFAMAHLQLGLIARRAGDRDTAVRELGRAIVQLEAEPADRLALFDGGFGRDVLVGLCRAELSGAAR